MGYIYLIRSDDGLTKIGKATDPRARLVDLNIGHPHTLTLAHVIETDDMNRLESDLHRRYAGYRCRGEWFELSESEVTFIQQMHSVIYRSTPGVPSPLKEKLVLWRRYGKGWIRWRITNYRKPDGKKAQKKSYLGLVSDGVLNKYHKLIAEARRH